MNGSLAKGLELAFSAMIDAPTLQFVKTFNLYNVGSTLQAITPKMLADKEGQQCQQWLGHYTLSVFLHVF